MPKKINTDIGVNVSVTEVPDVKTVEIKAPSQPVGKTDLELLGDVLSAFNPKLAELAKADAERQAKEDYVLGANQVNGMTLEDARKAHQEGFPDIYNGWARVGAAKQYATNATENFGYEFKKRYIENRNDPNYRWQEDYAQQSSQFLQGKEKDPFFQGAFQKDNEHIKKWVAEHEFALQSKELKERVSTDLSFQIQNLPAKVEDRLFAEFRDTIPIETSGKDYEKRKVEYISQNFQKVFDEEFNNLKTRLNPALTKSDFDEIFLSSAEAYSKFDGRYSLLYAKQIMEQRPDGTPAIRFNPKFDEKAARVIGLLKKSAETEQFFEKMKSNITADISNEDYKKMSGEVFTSLLNRHKQTGLTDSQSFEAVVKNLQPYLATNRPVPQIKELLNRPIGTTVTPDNRLALNVALMLDQVGALPAYFDGQENSSDTLKWRMAVMFYRNGEDPSNVIQKVGRQEQNKNISVLTEKEKQALGQAFKSGNQTLNNALNRDLVFSVAQYFKNVDSSGTAIETNTKNYIKEYYFRDAGGKFISKSRLKELNITEDQYAPFKDTAVQMVNDYFKDIQPSIETVKSSGGTVKAFGFSSKEQLLNQKQIASQMKLAKLDYNPNNLEMVIDTDKRTVHFLKDNKIDYYDPVIVKDKYGNEKRLQFNLEDVKKNYLSKKLTIDDAKFKKAQILEQAQKDYNAMKDMFAP